MSKRGASYPTEGHLTPNKISILQKIMTIMKFSGENSERVIDSTFLITSALWEMI